MRRVSKVLYFGSGDAVSMGGEDGPQVLIWVSED